MVRCPSRVVGLVGAAGLLLVLRLASPPALNAMAPQQRDSTVQSVDRSRVEELLKQAADLDRTNDQGKGNTNTEILRILDPLLRQPLEPSLSAQVQFLIASAYYR